MNYPAESKGVSIGILIVAPRGGELDPCPPADSNERGKMEKGIHTKKEIQRLEMKSTRLKRRKSWSLAMDIKHFLINQKQNVRQSFPFAGWPKKADSLKMGHQIPSSQ